MKKTIAVIISALMILSFTACKVNIKPPAGNTQAPPAASEASPSAQTAAPSAQKTAAPTEKPSAPAEEPPAATRPPLTMAGPVIIAPLGEIAGGYADGKWLTNKQAALLCNGALTMYEYSLASYIGTLESAGVDYAEPEGYVWSHTPETEEGNDESGYYFLRIPESYESNGDYEADPLSVSYLYSVPPEALPETDAVEGGESYASYIQPLIDAVLGQGAAQAQIKSAVSCDLDNDGAQETIVNAENSYENMYTEDPKNLYSIACVIESDGSVKVVEETYCKSANDAQYSQAELVRVQNVLDLDGDGACELVVEGSGWEQYWVQVFEYNGGSVQEVLSYGSGI
jgi:hypothetical protein